MPQAEAFTPLPQSPFLWVVCQIGAEPALKREMAREHPTLKFAYSRPGFVTFKSSEPGSLLDPTFEPKSVFARASGISCGKTGDLSEILRFARSLEHPLRLHVFERDQYFPGDEPPPYVRGEWARAVVTGLSELGTADTFLSDSKPEIGDLVFDIIAVEQGEWWFGYHFHTSMRSTAPGGRPEIPMPADAPSRAFVKLEEALQRSGARPERGEVAVEIGSSPGGASYALLQRGLRVYGIDPADMAPQVLAHPQFTHIAKPVARVAREELPDRVDWLLLDMNVAPSVSLFSVDRLAHRLMGARGGLQGVILTVKLNDWKYAEEIPGMVEHVRAMGFKAVRAVQLAHQRQEVLLYGFTPRRSLGTRGRAQRSRGHHSSA